MNTLLRKSRLFTGLSDVEIADLMRAVEPQPCNFRRGEVIWREGAVVPGIGLLQKGRLHSLLQRTSGGEQFMRLYEPGDIINAEAGLSRKQTSPVSVVAAIGGSYLWFPSDRLLDRQVIPSVVVDTLRDNLFDFLAGESIRHMKRLGIISRHWARERLMELFGTLRKSQGNEVTTGMTQDILAQYLLHVPSTVSLELRKMQDEGLIKVNRQHIKLLYTTPGKAQEEAEPSLGVKSPAKPRRKPPGRHRKEPPATPRA